MKALPLIRDIVLLLLVGWGVYIGVHTYFSARRTDEQIKNLKENVDIVVKSDSISSAKERVLLDSVDALRTKLEEIKTTQRNENIKRRRENEALAKKFRDVVVGDRPNF